MTELRKEARVYSLLKAKLNFDDGRHAVECLVKDVSDVGARIQIGDPLSLPEQFSLEIPMKAKAFRSKIKWRDHESVGVEFLDTDRIMPAPDQIEAFKAEILRLAAEVSALADKVEAASNHPDYRAAKAG